MSKINRIRFVNFTYNDNRHIYDQTFDFYGGENALWNLQNGGGKTVLVQMMLQPMSPRQNLKDRLFKSYFTKSTAPTYIMIEWILDNDSGYVLTGIGVKRVAGKGSENEESDNIRIITFISEYKRRSPFDIDNINLTYAENNIVKLTDFGKVYTSLSDAQKKGDYKVKVFRWEVAEEKNNYIKEMASYRIYQSEWKNLMVRINEAEAGLNSFFSDCKTNKALIKTWFIPTIEEQLNKNGKIIENIRELIKNHSEQLVKNEKILYEKSVFEEFKLKSKQVLDKLKRYDDTLKEIGNKENEIGNLYVFLTQKSAELSVLKNAIIFEIRNIENDLKEVRYDKLSLDYHKINIEMTELREQVSKLESESRKLESQIQENIYNEKIQLCAELNSDLKDIERDIITYKTQLEKLEMEQEEINRQVADISYTLSLKYREKISGDQLVLARNTAVQKEKEDALGKNKKQIKEKTDSIQQLNNDKSMVLGEITSFENKEKDIQVRYKDFTIKRNFFTREYDLEESILYRKSLGERIGENLTRIDKLRAEKADNEAKIVMLAEQITSAHAAITDISVKLNAKQGQYNDFIAKKETILKIITDYQLNEEYLFERDRIVDKLTGEIEHYHTRVQNLSIENSEIDKKLKMYGTGKAIELSEELYKAFEANNIDVDFGFEWLKNYAASQKEKEELIRNNPFIPYSLIISKKDYERLKGIDLKVFTSSALPLIQRESLEERQEIVWANQVVSVDKMSFVMSFNNKLLDAEHLKNLIRELNGRKEYNQSLINDAQDSIKTIQHKVIVVNSFEYSSNLVDELRYNIKKLEDVLEEKTVLQKALQKRTEDLRQVNAGIDANIAKREKEQIALQRQHEDIENLFQAYLGYLKSKDIENHIDTKIKNLRTEIEMLDEENEILQGELTKLALEIRKQTELIDESRNNLAKYISFTSGNLRAGEISELESALSGLESALGGDIQLHKELLTKSQAKSGEIKEKLEAYAIPQEEYQDILFDKTELRNIRSIIKNLSDTKKATDTKRGDVKIMEAQAGVKLSGTMDKISEEFNGKLPKEPELIGDTNFEKRKSQLVQQKNGVEQKLITLEGEIKNIGNEITRLSEYAGFARSITVAEPISEDLGEYCKKLMEIYRTLKSDENTQRNGLIIEFSNLENGFIQKAEIFRQLFTNLLNDDKKYRWEYGSNAIERALLQIDRKLEQYSIDIDKMSDMETHIIDSTFGYVRNVYDEMNSIDKNSAIEIEGERRKMLNIILPEKEKLEETILKEYIKGTINNCVNLYKQDKPMENLLANEINTYDLFDRLVGINKVEIILLKIEPNAVKRKTWRQVIEQTSGGERFVSAFVVFISLLTYMRGNSFLKFNQDSKVLIMDNPFGPITSEHLLRPLFDIARNYNTQLICLSDLKENAIYDRFNLVYALNIEKEEGRNEEYIEVKVIKKDVGLNTIEDEILTSSMFKIEQRSLLD